VTRTWTVLVCAMLLGGVAAAFGAQADEMAALRQENAELKGRVGRLEQQVQQLMTLVKQGGVPPAAGLSAQELQSLKTMARQQEEAKKPGKAIRSSVDASLYGHIKLDASYDTSRTSVGNFARWVESEEMLEDDDQFNMTHKETRLGLKLKGPNVGSATTSGLVEVDLYGSAAENKAEFMLRHAYLKVNWPAWDMSLLAGQTWDVISPLNPATLNYSVAWWAGNIGYRRPQIRLTKNFQCSDDVRMKVDVAASRSIGRASGFDPGDSGEDWKFPGLQGRVGVTFPLLDGKPTTVGVSGHYSKEEYDTEQTGKKNKYFHSWSANLDLTLPVNDRLTFKAEAFTGANLDSYLGGIGQGVNLTTFDEFRSVGGWLAASLGPWGKWRGTVGTSIESVDGDDVTAANTRRQNRSIFGNVIYSINEKTSIGFELSNWNTKYEDLKGGDSLRAQTSFIYRF